MKCYIDTKCINPRADLGDMEWIAEVVSEQDYHERGPHARSYRSDPHADVGSARGCAVRWAEDNGYTITSVDAVAA